MSRPTRRTHDATPAQLRTRRVLEVIAGREPCSDDVARDVEIFVNAGSRALDEQAARTRWLGWGIASTLPFPEEATGPSARSTLAGVRRLRTSIERWTARADVTNAYFMRKPPGLRFRIETAAPERLRPVVTRSLERNGYATAPLPYEPEEYQFGGAAGMAVAHRHFTTDSRAALAVLERAIAGRLSAPPWVLSLLCILDLASKVASDTSELWDLWSHLRLTGRLLDAHAVSESEVGALAARLRPFVHDRRAMIAALGRDDRELVSFYRRSNSRCARELRRVHRDGELLYAPRQVLPFWIVFHWNRWGFPEARQRTLAHGIERVLDPKRVG